MKFSLPYGKGKGINIEIPDDIDVIEILPKELNIVEDPVSLLQEAVDEPIGNVSPLEEVIDGKESIVVVVDDYTRKFPRDNVLIPFFDLLEELGASKDNITILIGTGTHKPPKKAEIEKILGKTIPTECKVVIHDCNADDLVDLGETSRGTPIQVNKIYHEADCKILLTNITVHYYAGFGGDRKSILPGISGEKSIQANHGLLTDPNAVTGNLDGNPVHLDMVEAASKVGADFVINVVAYEDDVIDIKAGELGVAFLEAVQIYKNCFEMNVDKPADMIILSAGGNPKDLNLYQGTKGLTHCKAAVRNGGHIIFLSESPDGPGNDKFVEWIEDVNKKVASSKKIETKLDKGLDYLGDKIKSNFEMGGHKAYYLLRERKWASISLLSSMDSSEVESKYFMEPIPFTDKKTIAKALQTHINEKIKELKPKSIHVVPNSAELHLTSMNILVSERNKIKNLKSQITIGPPFITKYEKSRIVGARALQLALGAPPLISDEFIEPDMTEPIEIAELELKEKVIPIIIRRILPSKKYNDYPIDIFPGDATAITRDVLLNP
ncbi:MAG: nickel-dependent lactate racemase [Candidatus Hodarchaeota archaeon]